ncbi:MAG: hypothetical protein ACI4V7_12085 [Succinivibrionaceae bacterium]
MRKIRINLYSKEFKPKPEILSLNHMLAIWLMIAVVIFMMIFYSNVQKNKLIQENKKLSAQIEDVESSILQTQALLSSMELDKSLEEKISKLKTMYASKQELITIIDKRSDLKSKGYAGFMYSLASISQPDLSVTNFKLQGLVAEISGKAKNAKTVPIWINQFSKYDDLRNKTFDSLHIKKDVDNNIVNFLLFNEANDTDTKEEKK